MNDEPLEELPKEIPCKDGFWYSGTWIGETYASGEGGSTGSSDSLCLNPAYGVPAHPGGEAARVGTPDDFCWDQYGKFGNGELRYNPGDRYRAGECDFLGATIVGILGWVWSESLKETVPVYIYDVALDCSPNAEVTCYKESNRGGAKVGTISPSDNPRYQTDFFVGCGESPESEYEVRAKGKMWHPCATVGWMYKARNFKLFEESYKTTVLRIQNEDHQPNLADLIEAMGRLNVEAGVNAGVMAAAATAYVQALVNARNLAINFRNRWPYIRPIPPFPPILT